jgi:5-hydroxyisourate hydrolase-like protein (transthyretin family)
MKLKLLLIACSFTLIGTVARANNDNGLNNGGDTKKTDIAGGVLDGDNKKPLGSVNITAYSASKKEKVAVTDGNGRYSFNDLKPGTYKLVFERDGYKKVTRDKVNIRSDEDLQLNIEMYEDTDFSFMPGQLLFFDLE